LLYERFLTSSQSNRKIGMMSTFFYKKYTRKGYHSVAALAEHLNLPEIDLIVVPICKGYHWYTILIMQTQSSPRQYNVIALDSLGYVHLEERDSVEAWFLSEYISRFPELIPTQCASVDIPVPLQPNWFDCGPYMVHNVDRVIRNLDLILAVLL
ncbi:hypothetical protein M422DRAFT_36373, partial [Sphaerobolus stellatus SS14]